MSQEIKLKGSKQDFQNFVSIQKLGILNMVDPQVRELAEITKDVHIDIISHYDKYQEAYNG